MTPHILSADHYHRLTLPNLTSCSGHMRKHFPPLHAAAAAAAAHFSLQSPPAPLSHNQMLTLASLALCIMYIPYLGDAACVCWILFCTPLGVFLYAPLRISHCLDSLGETPPSNVPDKYNCIFICCKENGPKSFTKLKNALTAVADAAVGNAPQCVPFISNNKNTEPTLYKRLLLDIVRCSLYPTEEYNASFKLLNQQLHEKA